MSFPSWPTFVRTKPSWAESLSVVVLPLRVLSRISRAPSPASLCSIVSSRSLVHPFRRRATRPFPTRRGRRDRRCPSLAEETKGWTPRDASTHARDRFPRATPDPRPASLSRASSSDQTLAVLALVALALSGYACWYVLSFAWLIPARHQRSCRAYLRLLAFAIPPAGTVGTCRSSAPRRPRDGASNGSAR